METLNDIYHRMYEVWKYEQVEPEEKLFVGRRPPKEVPGWMMKPPLKKEKSEREILEMEDEFLRKHGI